MNKRIAAVGGYYFCYFAAQACMAGYLNVYLEQSMELSGQALGLFNAITALAPAVVLPVVGWWADRTGWGGWMLSGALAVLLICGEFMSAQLTLLGLIAWGMGWEIARSACVSLADKGTVELAGRRYGLWRSFGSLGYLAGGMAMGFLARRWGLERLLFPVYLGLLTLALLLSFGFHVRGGKKPRRIGPGQAGRLLLLPQFRLSLVLGVVSSVAVSALQPWLGNHLVTTMGAGESMLSWNTLCCVVPELVLLPLFSGWLVPKWGSRACALVTVLGLAVRCLIYALAPTPQVFLLGSLLYGLGVCGQTAVNLAWLRRAVPEDSYATAVMLTAAVSCVGRAAAGWLFGGLYQYFGSRSIFWVLFGVAVGTLVLFFYRKEA